MKGYKVFTPEFKSKHGSIVFSENSEHKHSGKIELCASGFHFCQKAGNCFDYYDFDPKNIVCEVEALGSVIIEEDGKKSCTNHLRIGRRIEWAEVLFVANEGANNTGHSNTGNCNTGDRNTGDRNTGNRNTGYRNTGNWNTGNWNTGYRNTGNCNTGNWNTGYSNTGNWNTGNCNTGNWNTGNCNTGYSNTGNWNTGNCNTGYSNTGNWNTGAFCSGSADFLIFNKPSGITYDQFVSSRVFAIMRQVNTNFWVPAYAMTAEEKQANPYYKTCDGYLKYIPYKQAFSDCWHNWNEEIRAEFKALPNFNAEIFKEITSVDVNEK